MGAIETSLAQGHSAICVPLPVHPSKQTNSIIYQFVSGAFFAEIINRLRNFPATIEHSECGQPRRKSAYPENGPLPRPARAWRSARSHPPAHWRSTATARHRRGPRVPLTAAVRPANGGGHAAASGGIAAPSMAPMRKPTCTPAPSAIAASRPRDFIPISSIVAMTVSTACWRWPPPSPALSDKNGLMRRWGIHSFARCEIPSATSTVRPKSSASR